ncbi:MAG: glutamate 5-kinase [Marmoricola sp.]
MSRPAVAGARRVVVKVGSSSLTTTGGGLDDTRLSALVESLLGLRERGADLVLVSSGAIAAGLAPLRLSRRPSDLARQQAAASVGQGLLVHRYTAEFAKHGLVTGQVLLTVDDMARRAHYRNAQQTFTTLLDLGAVPIVNENDTVATSEIRFGDNDRLAALVAHLVRADLLVLLSDVDGLYDGPPTRPASRLIQDVPDLSRLDGIEIDGVGSHVGTGGMVTKLDAAGIATEAGIPVVLTSAAHAAAAIAGEEVGTYFHARPQRRSARELWLTHASEPKGRLTLDDGAVAAITQRNASLLAAGIVAIDGTFDAGETVDLVNTAGVVVARGLVNFDAGELPRLRGRNTRDLQAELGEGYQREVVHRDDLVVITG